MPTEEQLQAFGRELRRRREAMAWGMKEAERIAGPSVSTWRNYESGRNSNGGPLTPVRKTALKLIRAFPDWDENEALALLGLEPLEPYERHNGPTANNEPEDEDALQRVLDIVKDPASGEDLLPLVARLKPHQVAAVKALLISMLEEDDSAVLKARNELVHGQPAGDDSRTWSPPEQGSGRTGRRRQETGADSWSAQQRGETRTGSAGEGLPRQKSSPED